MSARMDALEAVTNAAVGLAVSTAAVVVLRRTGAWEAAPAVVVSLVFFGLSTARSFVLRRWFRGRG